MRLPQADVAVIPQPKLVDYLLNLAHPVGRPKARFFLARGFRREEPEVLRAALLVHPLVNAATLTSRTGYGALYEVRCNLDTPDGRNPCIRSIWIVAGTEPPSLVSAYPI